MNYGLKLLSPATIAFTGAGSSGSIGVNGSVTFTSCLSISLNSIFSSLYDNYFIVMRQNSTSTGTDVLMRLRLAGADASGTGDYTLQQLSSSATTVSGSRTTDSSARFGETTGTTQAGAVGFIYGPSLLRSTIYRVITVGDASSARINDLVGSHKLPTAYDGISFYSNNANTLTGLVSVYGFRG